MSGRSPLFRPGINAVAAAAVVLVVAGTGGGAAIGVPSAHPARAASSRVPFSQIGPGWSVAEYSAASSQAAPHRFKGRTTLYVVSPGGRKFAFYSWPANNDGPDSYYVVDWSRDRRRVLVQNFFNRFEQISVVTGKVISKFRLTGDTAAIGYTGSADQSILASANYSQNSNSIRTYGLNGKLTKVLTTSGPPLGAIGSPDGETAIVSADGGVVQVTNTGRVVKRLRPPVKVSACAPRRWWNATMVLASCNSRRGPGLPRLWLLPINGHKATELTAERGDRGPDLGDIGAWKLSSGVYLQALALSQCTDEYIAKQSRNGSVQRVAIPGVRATNDRIITGRGSRLLVRAENGTCGGGTSLVWFNPHAKRVTWAIRSPRDVVGVESAVPFDQVLTGDAAN
jgi:TolB protein